MFIELSDLKNSIEEKIDVFICSSSFEERCFSLPNAVKDLAISYKIIFYFDNLYETISENALKLEKLLGDNSNRVSMPINDPSEMLKRMSSSLNSIISVDKPQNFLIDITTFTHEGLLVLFKLFQIKIKKNDKLFFCYNGAKEYSYNEDVPENKWLSKGVKTVRSIVGYPGHFDPSKKNHLIILFGFERERTKKLIDIFEYDVVSIAFGSKSASITPAHQCLNENRHKELFDFYPNTKRFEISLIDPYETKKSILKHLSKFSECNTVIAPMNNKISTIGAGLAAFEKREIQLCYLTANIYNHEFYSIPSDHCYLFEINSDSIMMDSCGLSDECRFQGEKCK